MCSPATCRKCGKTTWTGCGRHVDQVMRNVRRQDRCQGHQDDRDRSGGFLGKIFGR